MNSADVQVEPEAPPSPPRPDLRQRLSVAIRESLRRAWRGENSGVLIIVVLVTIGVFGIALRDTSYLSSENLLSIVEQTTPITIMAIATVFVISSGSSTSRSRRSSRCRPTSRRS